MASSTEATQTGKRVTGRIRARTAMTASTEALMSKTVAAEERAEVAGSCTRRWAAAMK